MLFIRFLLEYIRVISLFTIVTYSLNRAFSALLRGLGLEEHHPVLLVLNISLIILFAVWYRRHGQYNGWYPVDKGKK